MTSLFVSARPGPRGTAGLRLYLENKDGQRAASVLPVADVHVPSGWPQAVAPPGTQDWEVSATEWLLSELVPDLRTHAIRRYPVALAAIARHVATGAVEGARDGYRTARTELGEALPPHAVDSALAAYKDQGRRLAAAAKGAELVERALRGTL